MANLENLSSEELLMIDGGGFWEDVAYVVGYAVGVAVTVHEAMQNQPAYGNPSVYK